MTEVYKIGLSLAETDFCYLDFLCGEKIYLSEKSPQTILSCGGVIVNSKSLNNNNMMSARDCLQRAWNNTMELVRDFEMYSKRIDDGEVAGIFKKMAEEQGIMAHDLRELYNSHENHKN